ncbi:hypothetical protein BKA64DRAFT_196642 [Cadophora sp. MPI-SDFR-AT-0126]|nr:hypothetical protein BKA64DRAFT_196642 [Leotiomycetes sp. MPI-SDFR-AT-0126]
MGKSQSVQHDRLRIACYDLRCLFPSLGIVACSCSAVEGVGPRRRIIYLSSTVRSTISSLLEKLLSAPYLVYPNSPIGEFRISYKDTPIPPSPLMLLSPMLGRLPYMECSVTLDSSILTTARCAPSRPKLPVHRLSQHDPVKSVRGSLAATLSVFSRAPDISIISYPKASPQITVQLLQNTEGCASVPVVID